MAESFNLLRRVSSLDTSMELPAYSGVVIFAGQDDEGNNIEYRAGDQAGTLLEITNEWGSQAQADAIYKKIRGYRYQPYTASGTHIDPSVEIGDAVTIADTYSGVFLRATTYGRDITSELEAPSQEEIEHEFQIQSPTNRQYERFTRSVRARLILTASEIAAEVEDRKAEDNVLRATLQVQANAIEARVTKEGGNASSFWWKLLSDSWSVGSGNQEILGVRKGGAYITGEIRATSGKIGGFDIKGDYLSYNGQTWGGTNRWGAYIGPQGLQLGNDFRVSMDGTLEASSGKFSGEVSAGNIQYGGDNGTLWGEAITEESLSGGWGGQLEYGGVSTYNTTDGINASLANADFAYDVANGYEEFGNLIGSYLSAGSIRLAGCSLGLSDISYKDGNGYTRHLNVVTWSGYD